MIGTLLVGVSLAGLIVGLCDAGMRKAIAWILGLNAALFGVGVLLMCTSPAASEGQWFTPQQVIGFGLCVLAFVIVGSSGIVAGIAGLIRYCRRAATPTQES